jgi:hypothetical protein
MYGRRPWLRDSILQFVRDSSCVFVEVGDSHLSSALHPAYGAASLRSHFEAMFITVSSFGSNKNEAGDISN